MLGVLWLSVSQNNNKNLRADFESNMQTKDSLLSMSADNGFSLLNVLSEWISHSHDFMTKDSQGVT